MSSGHDVLSTTVWPTWLPTTGIRSTHRGMHSVQSNCPLLSNRCHLSCDDCMEDKTEDYHTCTVLYTTIVLRVTFCLFCVFGVLSLVSFVSTSLSDCLERLVSDRNDLLRVDWCVKLYSLTDSLYYKATDRLRWWSESDLAPGEGTASFSWPSA